MKTTYQHGIELGKKYLALHKKFHEMSYLEILKSLRIDRYDMRRWTAHKYYQASRKPIQEKAYYIKDNMLWILDSYFNYIPYRGM